MVATCAQPFDAWLRGSFREMNTELEEIYFGQDQRHNVAGVGEEIKRNLVSEGREYIVRILAAKDAHRNFEDAYDLLGCVGFYMAACRRHEITEPSREVVSPLSEASALAQRIATALGIAPRLATSHLADYNPSVRGSSRSFTLLADEQLFFHNNALCMFAYMRAADALRRIIHIGISSPLAVHLLHEALSGLQEVGKWSALLFEQLDVERFFFCVRPYLKPHRVGATVYRGGNAGDFAGINVIDLLSGLCSADDPFYLRFLAEKFTFMMPAEQTLLKDCMSRPDFMSQFLDAMTAHRQEAWYRENLQTFLALLDAHADNAAQHHDQLVRRFIEVPSEWLPDESLTHITASGPPLPVLLDSMEKLRDLRMARERQDISSRYRDVERLKSSL